MSSRSLRVKRSPEGCVAGLRLFVVKPRWSPPPSAAQVDFPSSPAATQDVEQRGENTAAFSRCCWLKGGSEKWLIRAKRSGENCSYRLNQRRRFIIGASVVQVDLPGLGDGRGPVEIHQLVEGRELLGPQEVLASAVSHHFEVLDVALVSEGRRRRSNFVYLEDQLLHQHKPVIKKPLRQIQKWKITSSSTSVGFSIYFFPQNQNFWTFLIIKFLYWIDERKKKEQVIR